MKKIIFYLAIGLVVIFLLMLIHQKKNDIADKEDSRIHIVCTTSMLTQAVLELAGEWAHVDGLMGADIDPHLYRPRASDMYKISSGRAIIYHGLHLEGRMVEVLQSLHSQGKFVLAAADSLSSEFLLPTEYENMYDPHVWMDVSLWKRVVQTIALFLQESFPEHHDAVEQRMLEYGKKLDDLDVWIRYRIARIPEKRRILISAHDAFGYFGKAYGLHVEGLQGISTDAEIRMLDMERVVQRIIRYQIPTIFVEQTIPEKYLNGVRDLVKQNNFHVKIGEKLYSDALGGSDSGASTYIDMMKHNVNAIVNGLSDE